MENARRRTTIFQKIQLELTISSIIKKRIQPGKFPASSVGVVQIIAVVFLLSAAVSFLSINTCPQTEYWYAWLLPLATCSGAIITIIFYGIFTLGLAVKYTDFWFVTDIGVCIILAIFIIITSALSMTECTSSKSAYKIPGPLGICGAVFLIFSGAGMYIMYKNKEEMTVHEMQPRPAPKTNRSRTLPTDVDV